MDFLQSGFTSSRDTENKSTVKFLLRSFYSVEFSAAPPGQIRQQECLFVCLFFHTSISSPKRYLAENQTEFQPYRNLKSTPSNFHNPSRMDQEASCKQSVLFRAFCNPMDEVFRRSKMLQDCNRSEKCFCCKENRTGNLLLVVFKTDIKPQTADLQRLSRIQIYLLCRQQRLQSEGRMSSGNYEVDAELIRGACRYKQDNWQQEELSTSLPSADLIYSDGAVRLQRTVLRTKITECFGLVSKLILLS